MVALPYNDNVTTFYALMPRVPHRLTLHDLMCRLNASRIDQLIDKMETGQCIIRIPKIDLKTAVKLEKPLYSLGIKSLFQPGQANFALMVDTNTVANKTEEIEILSRFNADDARGTRDLKNILEGLPNPGLHVDSVLHDVKLTIDGMLIYSLLLQACLYIQT